MGSDFNFSLGLERKAMYYRNTNIVLGLGCQNKKEEKRMYVLMQQNVVQSRIIHNIPKNESPKKSRE